jgi:hypothetical protein
MLGLIPIKSAFSLLDPISRRYGSNTGMRSMKIARQIRLSLLKGVGAAPLAAPRSRMEAILKASMYKIVGSVGLLMLPAIALAQQPTELNIGWLSYSAGTISQDLSVRNNGLLTIKTVKIGCHFSHIFMHYSKHLGAGTVEIENIASNAVGYKTMTIASNISPTSATCHILSVTRPSVQY